MKAFESIPSLVPGSDDPSLSAVSTSLRFRLVGYVAVFGVALVVRLLYYGPASAELYTVEQDRYRIAHFYHEASASLAEGDDRVLFPHVNSPRDTLAAGYPPGYFAFMGAIYRIAGADMRCVLLVQCIVDAICVVGLVLVGELLFSSAVGVVAGLLMAISPQFSYLSLVLKPDTLVVLPVTIAIVLVLVGLRRERTEALVAAGVALGIACWLRQNALLLAPGLALAALAIGSPRKIWRGAIWLVAACVALVLPITLRNLVNYDAFVPVTFGDGFALISGLARDDFARHYELPRFAYNFTVDEAVDRGLEPDAYFREFDEFQRPHRRWFDSKHTVLSVFDVDGIERDRARRSEALGLVAGDPVYFGSLYARRVGRLIGFTEQLRSVPVAFRPVERRSETAAFYQAVGASEVWDSKNGSSLDHIRVLVARVQAPFRTGILLALAAIGLALTLTTGWRRAAFLLAMPVYYIGLQALMWSEFRHTLPSHIATFIFVAVAIVAALRLCLNRFRTIRFLTRTDETATSTNEHE